MKKAERKRKPTKFEELSALTEQDNVHQNSAVISSKRRVLQCELSELEASIVAVTATMANLRHRRAAVDAMLTGLTAVLENRCTTRLTRVR